MTYSEKLLDPRWQKRRLEIFQRDNWTCQHCSARNKTLHVHHLKYYGEPWMAPASALQTLCFLCHRKEELKKKVPGLVDMESALYELIEKLTSPECSPSRVNGYKMAIAMIEREIEKFYPNQNLNVA